MRALWTRHKVLWLQKSFLLQVGFAVFLLVISIFSTYYANSYTWRHGGIAVSDAILDNIPTVNVDFIFNEGALAFVVFLILILLYEPKWIPFTVKSVALFTIVRSVFITMTHLALPNHASYIDHTDLLAKISSGNDLFFSAHTGLPFLLALVFWRQKSLRIIFLSFSLIGGASVLLGHLHYSIDVFSAFFISYGVFRISEYFFPHDYGLIAD